MEISRKKQGLGSLNNFIHNHRTAIRVLALMLFSAYLLTVTLNHEYWFDEGQAWNIARDNDIGGIIGMMKYEGHPPLWHFVLKLFISLGCSYEALGLISWGVTVITAAVILFALPIKPCFKAAFLLSGGMLFVNSVISRVYCLIYLIVALIAVCYPHRKKHPLLFGLLVALLANTHIAMCGLVAILGIFMLIDFFREFKTNTEKQNILNASGLLIGGAGVIVLILPLLGCFQANSFAAERVYTFSGVLSSFSHAFSDIVASGCDSGLPMIFQFILPVFAQLLLIAAVLLLWRKRRTFVIELVFILSYMTVVGVIWYTISNRGALFLYTAAMIVVMGREEAPAESVKKGNAPKSETADGTDKTDGAVNDKKGAVEGALAKLGQISFYENVLAAVMSAVLFMSTPTGVMQAANDLRYEFTNAKSAGKFIRENITDNVMLASRFDDFPELLTYVPGVEMYGFAPGRFYTYNFHSTEELKYDTGACEQAVSGYDEVWYVTNVDSGAAGFELLYTDGGSIWVYRLGTEEFVRFVKSFQNISGK